MRAILFYKERSGHGHVLVRENLWSEMNSLYMRELEMRKTNSRLVFFF